MKVNNYDLKSDNLFGYGYLKELGTYAGEYADVAYDVLDVEEPSESFWCDIMVSDSGKIYAVGSEDESTQFGEFYFKEIFDGVEGDGEILENLGKLVAKYNVTHGTNYVSYSIRFIKLPNDIWIIYPTDQMIGYISSEDELIDALQDGEQCGEDDGYWEIYNDKYNEY